MHREMRQMGRKFTNRTEIPLLCKAVSFENEQFLGNDIHLHYNSQLNRLAAARNNIKYKLLIFDLSLWS